MQNIFTKPHPFYENTKAVLLRIAIISISVIFVLIVFQPFGTAQFQHPNKNLFLTGYGVITFLSFSLIFIGLPKISPNQFIDEKWVVWKQILIFLLGLIVTFSGCYLYLSWFLGNPLNWDGFIGFSLIALSVGVIPAVIIPLLDNNFKVKRHEKIAENLNHQLAQINPSEKVLKLSDENDKTHLTFKLTELIFIQAANNYVEIFFLENGALQKKLLRNSLTKIQHQISPPSIKKCHRSYLVNLNQVKQISGNAQGYKLHFHFSEEVTVPVSRSRGQELLNFLKK